MNTPFSNRRDVLLATASLLGLSACGNLIGPQQEPAQIYVLSPEIAASDNVMVQGVQLAVATPGASTSLATDRIALRRNQTLDYYANAQWTDATPQLVQNLLIEALEKAGASGAIAKDASGIRADYILESEVNSFEARYDMADGAPTIVVDIMVKLLSTSRGEIARARPFHAETVASANSIPAAVSAFDGALSKMLPEIARWVLAEARPPRH